MKKLLFIIPLVLLVLNFSHFQLHNDAVTYSPGGDLNSLKPSHWKMRDYSLDASASLSQPAAANNSSIQNEPYSQGAKFYGFPFGFYFKNDLKSSVSNLEVSAYSWLWALADGLLIILTLLIAIFFNRPRRTSELVSPVPPVPSPPSGAPDPSSIYPTPPNT